MTELIGNATEAGAAGQKGLKTGALGFVSNIVIGVASTAPAYSLAVSLGLVVAAAGIGSPAIMWLAFLPMLGIAFAYYYMNRADPDWLRAPEFFHRTPETYRTGPTQPTGTTTFHPAPGR